MVLLHLQDLHSRARAQYVCQIVGANGAMQISCADQGNTPEYENSENYKNYQ